MLSIGKLAPGQHNYYLDAVARGAEEYYTEAREAPGRWTGRASARLGLSCQVTAGQLGAVLAGEAPGGWLLVAKQGRPRVPGFDCTFSAPKSVSVLWALGPLGVRRQIRDAHDAAVDAAVAFLEDEASRARRGRGGAVQVEGDGFVAAAFRHRTSREGDPQLHTHVLVANLAYAPSDGRWTALDGRPLHAWAKTAGYVYEAKLRAELTRRLGVTWSTPQKGIADIARIPKRVLRHFSRRRQQIEAHMAEAGTTGAKAAQIATYATRKAKDTTTPLAAMFEDWRARATAVGFDDERLAAVLDGTARHEPIEPGSPEARAMFLRLALASGLTERQPTFNRRDVIMHICDLLAAGADPGEVIALADGFLESREVVHLVAGDTDRIRRKDGTSAPIPTDPSRFTTRDMLRAEAGLLRRVATRRTAGAGLADTGAVERAIASRATLAPEQAAMVRRMCLSGAGVDVVEGVAGAGKTFGLAAAHEAWTAAGRRVIGASLAARAARQLEEGSGIPSTTLHRLLADLSRPGGGRLGPDHVVVVDEAAMVGTRKLLELVAHADRATAKVVLIGDPCQVPAIDAGGALAGLARRGDRTALTANRRQREVWERQALGDLRSGRADEALAAYLAHDRVHHDHDPDALRARIVDDWWTATHDGAEAAMLALHRHQVEDLNARARHKLRAAGRLGADELALGESRYAVGDTVLAHRNDPRIGIVNGDRGRITAIHETARRLHVTLDAGTTVSVPFAYAEADHLTHGYAMTIHKTQGATIDVAHVLVHPSMAREQLYSAMSRGRLSNTMYVTADDLRADLAHMPEIDRDLNDLLLGIMHRSEAEAMAIDASGIGL